MINSDLYLKDTYLDKNISVLTNRVIIEYDLKSANTSLCREYSLLPIEKIEEIENMAKKDRVKSIGLLMRKDNQFKENIKSSFIDIRRRFFDMNDIKDEDILAVKKDAIFCLKRVENTTFGYCNFVEKNVYSSYLYVNNFELYYNGKTKYIDVKGISDDMVEKHRDYLLKSISLLFYHLETSDRNTQLSYVKRLIDRYKRRELEPEYYREFNQMSIFRVLNGNETYEDAMFIPYENKSEILDIDYNFFYILLPIIKILV